VAEKKPKKGKKTSAEGKVGPNQALRSGLRTARPFSGEIEEVEHSEKPHEIKRTALGRKKRKERR